MLHQASITWSRTGCKGQARTVATESTRFEPQTRLYSINATVPGLNTSETDC